MEKSPNERLMSWFSRTGWSKGEVARQVNRRARRLGAQHVSTDTSRVRRWLDGEQPREPIPKILSELLSERFGCVVTEEDLGLRFSGPVTTVSGVDLPWTAGHTVQLLNDFSRSDLMLNRRGWLGDALSVTAGSPLVEAMQRWLSPVMSEVQARETQPAAGRISTGELELLESTTVRFRRWDAQCGGGLRRKAVVGQLQEVTELLESHYPPPVRRRIFRVTAELSHLAGWMSYDMGLQPSAQKYFALALHAAKEAGDKALGAFVLSAMARQMMHLDRPSEALELLHLAQYGSRGEASPRTRAMLHALEGRAHANLGDAHGCHRAALAAEQVRADAGAAPEPDWMCFFTEAELHAENAHSFRDLAYHEGRSWTWGAAARPEMAAAVRLFEEQGDHPRSHALNLVGLSSVHLLQHEPEEAAAAALDAVDLATRLRSERVNTRLRRTAETAARLYPGVPAVVELSDRLLIDLPELAAAS